MKEQSLSLVHVLRLMIQRPPWQVAPPEHWELLAHDGGVGTQAPWLQNSPLAHWLVIVQLTTLLQKPPRQ